MKLKIRRAEKKLDRLLDLRDLNYEYQDIQDEIKNTIKDLQKLNDNDFVIQAEKKHNKKILDNSIFNKCKKCQELYLKSEKHRCRI